MSWTASGILVSYMGGSYSQPWKDDFTAKIYHIFGFILYRYYLIVILIEYASLNIINI